MGFILFQPAQVIPAPVVVSIAINSTPITGGVAGRLLYESATNKVTESYFLKINTTNGTFDVAENFRGGDSGGSNFHYELDTNGNLWLSRSGTRGNGSRINGYDDSIGGAGLSLVSNSGACSIVTGGLYATKPDLTVSNGQIKIVNTLTNFGVLAVSALGFMSITPTGTNAGVQIGSSNTNLIGLYNTTPVAQATTAVASATIAHIVSTPMQESDTIDGYTIAQVVKALRNIGILA